MSILLQILLTIAILATIYALIVHNRKEVQELIAILPDFGKLYMVKKTPLVKVVVFVPDARAEAVRKAIAEAGAGILGHYTCCSFSSQGIGRYRPERGANPMIGTVGKLELIEEERIEVTLDRKNLDSVLAAIKMASPYEETLIDIYPLEAIPAPADVHSHHI